MTHYDVYIVPTFKLDLNFNYEIKVLIDKNYLNIEFIEDLEEMGFAEDYYFNSLSKRLYYYDLSCFFDLKEFITVLKEMLKKYNIKSN